MEVVRSSSRKYFFFGALGGVLFGYDTGVISGAMLFIKEDFEVTPFLEGAVVAGAAARGHGRRGLPGPLSDRLGRRRLILVAAVIFTVGALGSAVAPERGAADRRALRARASRSGRQRSSCRSTCRRWPPPRSAARSPR